LQGFLFFDASKNIKQIGIDGEKWIFTNCTKTNTSSRFPLLPVAQAITEKYKNHLKVKITKNVYQYQQ